MQFFDERRRQKRRDNDQTFVRLERTDAFADFGEWLDTAADEIAHAQAVVAAYDEAARSGRGAVGKDGKMIDFANIRMARALLGKFDRMR